MITGDDELVVEADLVVGLDGHPVAVHLAEPVGLLDLLFGLRLGPGQHQVGVPHVVGSKVVDSFQNFVLVVNEDEGFGGRA